MWMLPSFNKQAICAISPSYQPVTLYGEDKSRQLKFKLPCALPWLPSSRVSQCVSLWHPTGRLQSYSASEAKWGKCSRAGKHAGHTQQTQIQLTQWRSLVLLTQGLSAAALPSLFSLCQVLVFCSQTHQSSYFYIVSVLFFWVEMI